MTDHIIWRKITTDSNDNNKTQLESTLYVFNYYEILLTDIILLHIGYS